MEMKYSRGAIMALLPLSIVGQVCAKPANVLIIMTDEHNFKTLGCYREHLPTEVGELWGEGCVPTTPNIDYLAHEGAMFTQHYVYHPVSAPSRAAFFSGQYIDRTGMYTNDLKMNTDVVTFAQTMLDNGYKTGYAGKWHLWGNAKPGFAPEGSFGFDDNRYMFNRGHWKNVKDDESGAPYIGSVDKKGAPSYALGGADEKSFTTDYLADKTIDFIEANSDDKFLYVVSFPDPHGPNTVREPYASMYNDMDIQIPESASTPSDNPYSRSGKTNIKPAGFKSSTANYFGMVKCIDDNVGRIIETLKAEGIFDNTMIIFTSDHGDMVGEHNRYNKSIPLESSAKVPFIVCYKDKVASGNVSGEVMSNVDVAPTILSMLGIAPQEEHVGVDCSSLLKKRNSKLKDKHYAFFRNNDWVAIADNRYKLIFWGDDSIEPALFDVLNDPNEYHNLYKDSKYRAVIEELAAELYNKVISSKESSYVKHEHISGELSKFAER